MSAKDSKISKSKVSKLARGIYSLQNGIVRELNNAHIFLEQALPLLENAKSQYEQSSHKKDRRYYVPSVDRKKFARRTDKELKAIYDGYLASGLCEAFLVRSLSQFENFLGDVLAKVLAEYPQKLTTRVQDIPTCPAVTPVQIVAATDKESLLKALIRDHLSNVFRQRPKSYMTYVTAIVGGQEDASFRDLYEVAATRDLVVHNDSIINQLYMDKAGSKARGGLGDKLIVDKSYLYDALAKLKKVSGAVKREAERAFATPKSRSD
jgi:hypothetical protein